ncbi:mobile mystery protein A [Nocardioides sp. AN3]
MAGQVTIRARGRAALDRRLAGWRDLPSGGARPHGGWIRAIREALGMTAGDLAERLNVTQSTVTRIEQSERADRIQLETMRRVADALGCDLVYALVPRRSLEDTVMDRARDLARERLGRVEHTMALEDQGVDRAHLAERLDLLTHHYLATPGLWHSDRSGRPRQG